MKLGNRHLWPWALLAAALALACDSWTSWDDLFNRPSVGTASRGWTGGDGAISAELPGNRAFWIFGDTLISRYEAQGTRKEAQFLYGSAALALGHTIGIQTNRTSPSPNSIQFWARKEEPPQAPVQTTINTGVSDTAAVRRFFTDAQLGVAAGTQENILLWPMGAECLGCSGPNPRLVVAFARFDGSPLPCDPHPPGGTNLDCIPKCDLKGESDGLACDEGFQYAGMLISRFKKIDLDPNQWESDGTALQFPLVDNVEPTLWGASFVETGTHLWIFGRKIRTSLNATPVASDLMVARVTPANLLSKSCWEYWNGLSWMSSENGQVPVASKAGYLDSVDKITRDGTTRYLLVHGDEGKMLYARVSNAPYGSDPPTWYLPSATTPRIELSSIDFPLAYHTLDWINRNKCTIDLNGAVPNWSACGVVYHGLAHAHLAVSDASGPLVIPVSYVAPEGPNPLFNPNLPEGPNNFRDGAVSTAYYRPRFTVVQLDKLKPWCTTDCWEGIVRDHATRQLGSQPVLYSYDVQKSARFYAALTRVNGSANLKVEFYTGLVLKATHQCTVPSGNANMRVCNVAKPSGATTAVATVSGASTDTYAIRTHYAGLY